MDILKEMKWFLAAIVLIAIVWFLVANGII